MSKISLEIQESFFVPEDENSTKQILESSIAQKQFRACHILVETEGKAQDILSQFNDDNSLEKFTALAKEHSTCPSKERGGDLGWFSEGQMVKPFEEAVLNMDSNSISSLVQTQFGFHLIYKISEIYMIPVKLKK